MQDKIFKVKNFEVTHKSVKSVKVFSLEIFRLYGIHSNIVHNASEGYITIKRAIKYAITRASSQSLSEDNATRHKRN